MNAETDKKFGFPNSLHFTLAELLSKGDVDDQWLVLRMQGVLVRKPSVVLSATGEIDERLRQYLNPRFKHYIVGRGLSNVVKFDHDMLAYRVEDVADWIPVGVNRELRPRGFDERGELALHCVKLPAHHNSLSSNGKQHEKIEQSYDSCENYVTLKPRVGLWHYLDSLSATTRLCLVVLGLGLGIGVGCWGVNGDGWKRFALGCGGALILWKIGWNVLIDWLLRSY